MVVLMAVPPDSTSSVSLEFRTMPLLVAPELTIVSAIQSPKILVIPPCFGIARRHFFGVGASERRYQRPTLVWGRYPLALAAHKRESAANAWQSLTMAARGFRVR